MTPTPSRRLKFLFISADKFPPYRVDVAVLFGQELAGRGHKIDWILQSQEACHHTYWICWSGGRAKVGRTDLKTTRSARLRKHLLGIINDFSMLNLARHEQYDFIQVKDKFISAIIGLITARSYSTKFFFWLSYPYPEASLYVAKEGLARYPIFYRLRGSILMFILYRIILPRSDHVFVQSEQMKKDICQHNIDSAKVTPVPMGISLEQFPARSETDENTSSGTKTLVYLGTLVKARALDFLVRVLYLVRKINLETTLIFVGDGADSSDRDTIIKEAEKLNLKDAIKITGFLPRKEALQYVKKADICLSPFKPSPILDSTSPTKLLEYMAMSKPVIANDHPEQRLVIEESGGGICVPYNEQAFTQAILELLNNPVRSGEMGKLGRRYIEERRVYSSIASRVESKYFEVLSASELI